ncbi:MAG: hybrid sensor histidine kinase/response regulator [Ardenticatenaceae bacterium]|nr:hybrid sensor histidine kinase/response regulator [Ardenticatenaceae bacterium]
MANLNLLHRFSPLQDETVQLNMDDLRGRLAQRLALLAIAVAQFFILFYESAEPFPLPAIGFWLLLTAVAVGALSLSNQKPRLARHLLVWGLTAVLLFAMIFLPAPWLPFVGVLLIFCQAMLVQGSEFVTGTMMVGTAVYLSLAHNYPYPLAGVLTNLILAVLIAWLTIRALYTALDWLSKTQRRAEQLLDVTRSQQAELRSTVKSLQITNEARLQAERELLIANKQARESQRMKEQFAANISHEFRTPLSIILGFSEVMYLSPEVYGGQAMPPKLYRDVSQIYRNSRHLMSMIDDILDLSHFEMTGFTLNKEPTNLEPLMQESLSMVADLFRNDAVTLVADIEPELPLLELDRTRMRQVFLNLLNNACRFTEQGTVTLRAFRQEGELHIQVADTGPGIPEEQLARIFTEFYQVDYSLSRKHGGAGLGLAICHRFVQAHNGRIWVNSILGEGATFTIALPIEELSPGGRLYRTRSLEAQPSDKLPPVFMIDSDPTVVSLVQRHLTEFDIVPLPDAADLAEQVAEQLPAAVVWNVAPGSVPPAPTLALPVPVISCSLPSRTWMADAFGALACLNKPINFELLNRLIDGLENVQNILVVDDNSGICQLVERGLSARPNPVTVRVAYDGESGLNAMRQQPPDLLLLDLIMPRLNGREVFDIMQQDELLANIPVVLLTATDFISEQFAGQTSQLVVQRSTMFQPIELLHCIQPIVKALQPQYGNWLADQSLNGQAREKLG